MAKTFFLLLFFIFISIPAAKGCDHGTGTENNSGKVHGSAGKFALVPVHLYQKYLSPVIGGRCPMHPSCSGYAHRAITKHGAVLGWIMACDRLMRCGRDEIEFSPSVKNHGDSFCHDPVENNDFWLK